MSAMVLIDREGGFNIAAAKLAIKVPLRVSCVGVEPSAIRIEHHSFHAAELLLLRRTDVRES